MTAASTGRELWADALRAAALLRLDPRGLGGIVLRARPGPVRDRFLARLRGMWRAGEPWRRLPAGIGEDRLAGGLDLPGTLRAGRPVLQPGLLAEADGGVLVAPMAERLDAGVAAHLMAALDDGHVVVAREGFAARLPGAFALVAIDESLPDEPRPAAGLRDRLAFHIDLETVALGDTDESADSDMTPVAIGTSALGLPRTVADDAATQALCAAALAFGVTSLRAPLLALRTARAAAALAGRDEVGDEDLALAARLVISPRATALPAAAPDRPEDGDAADEVARDEAVPADARTTDGDDDGAAGDSDPDRLVLDAVRAAIPPGLLAAIAAGEPPPARGARIGTAGVAVKAATRGRPIGARRGDLRAGRRLALIETLRAAAPWQGLRRAGAPPDAAHRIVVRADDIRIRRFRQRSETETIFAVDASGSAALHRMGEAKGAVELLLADCYVRRDQVALVAFRRTAADILLPPTRSLTRARRGLAALPCGGGTPLAAGIDAALALAVAALRRGRTPALVFLTDGRANVARDGAPGRDRAVADALAAARAVRAAGVRAILIDTSRQPHPLGRRLADEMAGRYVLMPSADASSLSAEVRRSLSG